MRDPRDLSTLPNGPRTRTRARNRPRLFLSAPLMMAALGMHACTPAPSGSRVADLIYTGARFYTMDVAAPWADAVAVKDGRFVEVGTRARVDRWRGAGTRTVDLGGAFAVPGLNDGHTHFDSAGRLLLGANLLEVSDEASMREAIGAAASRMPLGSWITGGSWGAYESWSAGSTGQEKEESGERSDRFMPHRGMIDPVSPDHPVLVSRWDASMHLANSAALRAAGIDRGTAPPRGVTIHKDPDGTPTGLFEGSRGGVMRLFGPAITPPTHEQHLAEARIALAAVREAGITMINDITSDEMLRIYQELLEAGELTVRVRPRPTLDKAEAIRTLGITTGVGGPWLRFTGLKGFVDGIMGGSSALFFEPYDSDPTNSGSLRAMMSPPGNMERLVRIAGEAGMTPHIHAIGDRGVSILLDIYEAAISELGLADHRWRMIHAQVVREQDFRRFGELGLVAEVNPYHLSDDMRWMEERIGERIRGAYAFRSLKEGGAVLVFGSDWPGTNAAWYHEHPKYLIHAAVNRTTLDGEPSGGWFPDQKLTVHEALEAFTINGAWANFEEDEFGSIQVGKWADLTVLDRNLLEIDPSEILQTEVLYTIIEGRIVYQNPAY